MRPESPIPPRSSPAARLGLAVVVALLVYASLFPNTGWVHAGISPFAWITAPFPRYWTAAEIIFNVLVYLPLGALLAWSLHPRLSHLGGVMSATLIAAALSFSMECLQTFVPGRVASNVDFGANTLGAFLGAALGVVTSRQLIDLGWHVHWGDYILKPRTHAAIVLGAVWLLVQMPPQAMLFGTGNVIGLFPDAVLRLEAMLPGWAVPPPEWRVRAEQWCTALAIIGISMLLAHCLRPLRLRALLVPVLVLLALGIKAAAQPLAPPGGPDTLAWLTPGAWRGLLMGTLVSIAMAYAPPAWQRAAAIIALIGQLLIVNLFPLDRYFLASVASGYTGLLYLESLAQELAAGWPVVALLWMLFGAGSLAAARAVSPDRGVRPD